MSRRSVLAEGVGFEPAVRSRIQRFSGPPRPIAPASLRAGKLGIKLSRERERLLNADQMRQ
jgi:hypothetical protein